MSIGIGLDGANFLSGHANHVLSEGIGLLVPLFADGGSALHVVVFLQLLLGLEGSGGVEGTVSINGNLVLGNIQLAADDLAVLANQNGGGGAVHLSVAGSVGVSVSHGGVGNDGHTGLHASLGSSSLRGSSLGGSGLRRSSSGRSGGSGSSGAGRSAAAGYQAESQAGSHDQSNSFFHDVVTPLDNKIAQTRPACTMAGNSFIIIS